jgi:hypothetical protein
VNANGWKLLLFRFVKERFRCAQRLSHAGVDRLLCLNHLAVRRVDGCQRLGQLALCFRQSGALLVYFGSFRSRVKTGGFAFLAQSGEAAAEELLGEELPDYVRPLGLVDPDARAPETFPRTATRSRI